MYIFVLCLSVSVYYNCSPLPGEQPWQVRYHANAHKPQKVGIMNLRPNSQQAIS